MRLRIYNSKYFIAIGIFMLLCFSGIGFFMTTKFNERTEFISIDMANQVYQLKSNVIKNEFNGFVKGLSNVEAIVPQISSKHNLYQSEKIVDALLLSHPKINHGCYAIADAHDTVYRAVSRIGDTFIYKALTPYQQKWIKGQLNVKDTVKRTGVLVSVADSLHGLLASRHRLANSSMLVFGLDINFNELQRYLWSVDSTSRAYAFIIDQHGYYITNQLEKLIGKHLPPASKTVGTTFLPDSLSSYEYVNSSYLEIPVVRFYTPMNLSGMKWTMIVDTPRFTVEENVKAIQNYVLIMFGSTALVVLLLIAWSQAKWQREFMLRQQIEMNRQELLLDKQALSLTAERQQKENALLQLDKLKEKVDPHFLFNSLSSLNGLIEEQPELAKSFVVKLSRVYRYVLDPSPNGLEEVAKELRFATEYFFLLKIRFGDALAPLEVKLSEEHLKAYIPFMSIQTLLENAVKHNIVSKSKPLHISIQSVDKEILVVNNLQLRNDVKDSGKQGLAYLQQVYAHFGDYDLTYMADNDKYICCLPVIKHSRGW